MQIQTIQREDLPHLSAISPKGWGDVSLVFRIYLDQPFFFPIKLVFEKKIIGLAQLIIIDKIGWLGNIVVQEDFRGQGLGSMLTEELMKIGNQKGCESFYLLATPLGKFVYNKLGFQENGEYLFFQNNQLKTDIKRSKHIIPFEEKYKKQILDLDRNAMGEDRSAILQLQLHNSWVYKKTGAQNIDGFFMPDLGNGLTICTTEQASFDFIKERERKGLNKIVLPEENTTVIEFLKNRGYVEFREIATFMFLGKMKTWNPKMVVCRIAGNLG